MFLGNNQTDPTKERLISFYYQFGLSQGVLQEDIDNFFTSVKSQPPKKFVTLSKRILKRANELVFIGKNFCKFFSTENFDFWPKPLFSTKISIFDQKFYFRPKFGLFASIFILDQNFESSRNFLFSTKISIFDQNSYQNFDFRPKFLPKFRFSTKISMFDQNFDFRRKFWFSTKILTKISIFDQNFDFRRKFWFSTKILTKISMFDQNFDFRRKFWFSTKISIFD